MKQNLVLAERTARFGLGMFLIATPVLELATYPFNLLGVILVATAALGYCPFWAALGLFSAPARSARARTAAAKA